MMNAALHDICTRIARLETERKELAAEVAKIKKDAKEQGYDAGLITKTVAIMLKSGKKQREALEQHELFDTYLNAVGLLRDDDGQPTRKPEPEFTVSLNGGPQVPLSMVKAALDVVKRSPGIDDLPLHDPETGEITEQPPTANPEPSSVAADGGLNTGPAVPPSTIPISSAHCLPDDSDEGVFHLRSAAGEQVSDVPPRLLAGSLDMGDIPEVLDRRKRQEVAA